VQVWERIHYEPVLGGAVKPVRRPVKHSTPAIWSAACLCVLFWVGLFSILNGDRSIFGWGMLAIGAVGIVLLTLALIERRRGH
jgi:hypothetical protein